MPQPTTATFVARPERQRLDEPRQLHRGHQCALGAVRLASIRKLAVGIGEGPARPARDEHLPRHREEGLDHLVVGDLARADLVVHHPLPKRAKSVMGLLGQQYGHVAADRRRSYCSERRIQQGADDDLDALVRHRPDQHALGRGVRQPPCVVQKRLIGRNTSPLVAMPTRTPPTSLLRISRDSIPAAESPVGQPRHRGRPSRSPALRPAPRCRRRAAAPCCRIPTVRRMSRCAERSRRGDAAASTPSSRLKRARSTIRRIATPAWVRPDSTTAMRSAFFFFFFCRCLVQLRVLLTCQVCSLLSRSVAGLERSLVQAEWRVGVSHQPDIGEHAVAPAVDAHHQRVHAERDSGRGRAVRGRRTQPTIPRDWRCQSLPTRSRPRPVPR